MGESYLSAEMQLDGLRHGLSKVFVQLLFCRVLLPGFVKKNSSLHPSFHRAFPLVVSLKSKWCNQTRVLIRLQLGRIIVLSY